MLKKIATALFCTTAPFGAIAQQVELRSADGFISVNGEIISFDGTLLTVETSVGVVSVPASEVGCYGTGCVAVLQNTSLGLTAAAFREVVIGDAPTVSSEPAVNPPAQTASTPRSDTLTIGFTGPGFEDVFRIVTDSYSLSPGAGSSVNATTADEIGLSNSDRQENATLRIGDDDQGDVVISGVPLAAAAPAEYFSTTDWALTGPLSHQMLATQAFGVIAASDVGVTSISMDDLARIYAGEIDNWSMLGGPDKRILPLQLPVESSIRDEFIGLVMSPVGKVIADNVLTMADEAVIASSVNQFPGSISLISLGQAGDNTVLPITDGCGEPMTPNAFNLASGDYPLIRPVMARFETPANTGLITEFFDSAATNVAQGQLVDAGFVDLRPIVQDADTNDARLMSILSTEVSDAAKPSAARMFELLFSAERLSVTMIGGVVSGAEGGWNRAMFNSLAETLAGSDYAGREIFFVGLGQSSGGDKAAIDASVLAASEMQAAFGQFASEVIASNGLQLSSYGFGGVAQVTCYTGQVAVPNHSRVEIWVR